jgi:hypothetical protein
LLSGHPRGHTIALQNIGSAFRRNNLKTEVRESLHWENG